MFKLIKMTGSGSNIPEPVKFPVQPYKQILKGGVYYVVNRELSSTPNSDNCPKFIPLQDLPEGHGRNYVWGYYVTDNMIFEADVYDKTSYFFVGDIIPLRETMSNIGFDTVDSDVGEDAIVIATNNSQITGKVIVALEW